MLGAIGVFIIERQFVKAATFALVGAGLTFFGFMHGEAIGVGQTPLVAVSYLAVAGILVACGKFARTSSDSVPVTALEHHGALEPGE